MPHDEDPRQWRPSWTILGAAGIVIATVFAVVASLASKPANHVQPVPDLPGPVVGSSAGNAPAQPPAPSSASATISAPPKPTTTTSRPPDKPATSTNQAALPPPAPPGQPKAPAAAFTASCDKLVCTFDGRPSTDGDGRVIYFAWGFGDQSGDQGQNKSTVQHAYRAAGFYDVTLVVMDNDGRIGQTSKRVTVTN